MLSTVNQGSSACSWKATPRRMLAGEQRGVGGSTFKNPPGRKAWQLIDAAGCRGLAIGDAQVSELHCNFLINRGDATAADIETLGETVRKRVKDDLRHRSRMGDQADRHLALKRARRRCAGPGAFRQRGRRSFGRIDRVIEIPASTAAFWSSWRNSSRFSWIDAITGPAGTPKTDQRRFRQLQAGLDRLGDGVGDADGVEMARVVGVAGARHDHGVGPQGADLADDLVDLAPAPRW